MSPRANLAERLLQRIDAKIAALQLAREELIAELKTTEKHPDVTHLAPTSLTQAKAGADAPPK